MTVDEAIDQACSAVGIKPPRGHGEGRWLKTDTLKGKSGKGDGRVIVHERSVTAWNWQTGEKVTVNLKGEMTREERREVAREIEADKKRKLERARQAADLATRMCWRANAETHPYLAAKGFPEEKALTIGVGDVQNIVGERCGYLIAPGGQKAIIIPARIGSRVSSAQLIWEDGTKKFLFGGVMDGASHRISNGYDTWLCEGFATGLSIRTCLRGLKMQATVLCCFSASNIVAVARQIKGRTFVATDNDKPLPQYGGLGTGEHFAKQTGLPYGMPPNVTDDFNDLHQKAGIFVVQRALAAIMSRSVA